MYLSKILKAVKQIAQDINIIKQDVLYLTLQAGNGGRGLLNYNGIGGNGGNIYLVPSKRMTFAELLKTFQHQKLVKVEPGQHSKRVLLIGKHGENKIIEVPLGCECVNEGNSILLARCNTPNRRYLVASGGRGGCAENGYVGERGETVHVSLHLKLRPNIGLVGFPNAGKSTLLKAFVPEKPVKIANYPFTTTKPQLCYVKYEDTKVIDENFENMEKNLSTKLEPFSLSVADLPGLIEGASQNRGCGHAFLKHMEYSEILVIVIDVFGFQLAPDHRLPYR